MNQIIFTILTTIVPAGLVGYLIFRLQDLRNKEAKLESNIIDLVKLESSINANREIANKISSLDTSLYLRYFTSSLDKFQDKPISFADWQDYKGPLIYFDRTVQLPILNEYLVEEFRRKLKDKSSVEKLIKIDLNNRDDKKKFIVENHAIVISYDLINAKLISFNENIDYYRDLIQSLVSLEIQTDKEIGLNLTLVLNYCLAEMVERAKELCHSLDVLHETMSLTEKEIEKKIGGVKKQVRNANIIFFGGLVVLSIILIA